MSSVCGNASAARALAAAVRDAYSEVDSNMEMFKSHYEQIKDAWRDSGSEKVDTFYAAVKSAMAKATDSVPALMKGISEYAAFLERRG